MTLVETTVVNSPWRNYLRRIVAVVRGVQVVFVSCSRMGRSDWEIYSVDLTGLEEFAGYASPELARRLDLYAQVSC